MSLLRVLADPDSYAVTIRNGEVYVCPIVDVDPAKLYPKERHQQPDTMPYQIIALKAGEHVEQ